MIKSIPTVYRGVQLKSRLEADTAFLLDRLGLSWKYEPQSFLLLDGTHYMPDFWVADLRLWVECRGYESEHGARQIEGFKRLIQGDPDASWDHPELGSPDISGIGGEYLVLTTNHAPKFWESFEAVGTGGGDAAISRCTDCKNWFFLSPEGAYRCRRCGAWDGDHCLDHMDRFLEGEGKLTLECFKNWRRVAYQVKPWLQAHSLL